MKSGLINVGPGARSPEAERLIADVLAALRAPAAPVDDGPTVAAIWEQYRAARQTALRSWRTGVETRAVTHVLPYFGERPAMSLTAADVDAYRAKRRSERPMRGGRLAVNVPRPARAAATTAAGTRNREVMVLMTMLRFAVRRKLIPTNPLAGIEMEPEDNVRPVVIDEPEFHRILRHVRTAVLRAFVLTVYDSGMRRAEAAALKWPQVQFDEGLIYLAAHQTKTRQARIVHLSERAAAELRKLPRTSPFVFANERTGRPYDPSWLYEGFKRAADKAGVRGPNGERVWLHDLRRSFVTLARRRGIAESTIMLCSGHRSGSVFRRYSINSLEDVRAARDVLEQARASAGGAR